MRKSMTAFMFLIGAFILVIGTGCGSKKSPTSPGASVVTPKTLSESVSFGPGTDWDYPTGMLYHSGALWFTDIDYSEMVEINPPSAASVATVGHTPPLFYPYQMAFDPVNGNIYVANSGTGASVWVYAAGVTLGALPNSGAGPMGVAVNSNATTVYVSSNSNNELYAYPILSNTTAALPTFGTPVTFGNSGSGQVAQPDSLLLDSGGNLWVVDAGNHRLAEYNAAGVYQQAVSSSLGPAAFGPTGMTFDASGCLYAVDATNKTLVEFNSADVAVTAVGSASFHQPYGVTNDGSGNFYISDQVGVIWQFH